jgi:hypothetical protein
MALTATQPLPVKQVIYTSSGGGKLTFILATPYLASLYLGSIVITRTTSGHISGTITPGADATHGGKALIYVDATTFADARSQAIVPFKVVLSYDTSSYDIVHFDILRDVAAVSRDLLEALMLSPQHVEQTLLVDESRRPHASAE